MLNRKFFLVSFLLASFICAAVALMVEQVFAAPAVLSFGGSEKKLPRGAILSVATLDLQTGVVLDIFQTKPRARVTAKCASRFCISSVRASAVVNQRGRRSFQRYFGVSKGYGGEVLNASNRVVKIALLSPGASSSTRAVGLPAITQAAGKLRVGVPGSGFTINTELAELIGSPANLASPVITTLVQSPCYRPDGTYEVLEVDPRSLNARKKELELIKKGYVKNDPNFTDQYARPDHSVKGSVSQTGNSGTATVEIVNSAGQTIASATASSADGGWFEALNRATLDLASQLCGGPKVNIALAQCFLRECSCGPDSFGYRIDLRIEGVAKLPINGLMYASIPATGVITQNCGGASDRNFGGALGFSRTSDSQPDSFEYHFGSVDREAPSCGCPRAGAPENISFIATALDVSTGERDDAFANDVRCVVTPQARLFRAYKKFNHL